MSPEPPANSNIKRDIPQAAPVSSEKQVTFGHDHRPSRDLDLIASHAHRNPARPSHLVPLLDDSPAVVGE